MAVNVFSALTFTEFVLQQSGMGTFNNNFTARPEFDNRGNLRYENLRLNFTSAYYLCYSDLSPMHHQEGIIVKALVELK